MAPGSKRTPRPSYWTSTAGPTPERPPLGKHHATEILVIGGGITGLTTALYLARAGSSVTVIDAGRVGEGVTGYSTAKLTALQGLTYARLVRTKGAEAAAGYAAANVWGVEEVARLVGELEIDCDLQRHLAITFATEEDGVEEIEAEAAAARTAGLPVELVEEIDLPFEVSAAVQLADQASFHPLRYCQGIAGAVERAGATIHEGTRAVEVRHEEAPLLVHTENGHRIAAEHVVFACGLPFVDRPGFFATTHPSRSYCVAFDAAGSIPSSLSISSGSPTRSIRPIHGPNGARLLLVAGFEHKVGQAADTRARYQRIEEFTRTHFEVGPVVRSWSAQDYIPVDGVPLVGQMPHFSERTWVATGFRKWGLTNGTAAARMLADAIGGADNAWKSVFDSGRSQLRGGAGEALRENANVVKRFVGDRIRQARGKDLEELALGAGAVCRVGGEPVAAYRDDGGALHLLSPVCTHMGCRVTWNAAESSWDCPCHGSRFSVDGEVLTGPAVKPLGRADRSEGDDG